MSTEKQNDMTLKILSKPGWKSKTFTVTVVVETIFAFLFWLSLFYNVDPEIGARVRSGIVLAMTIVALGYTAPQIAHDILTRLPLAKGMGALPPELQEQALKAPDDKPQG
jgi:NO-binding membrane sensor protein with MHYT domain